MLWWRLRQIKSDDHESNLRGIRGLARPRRTKAVPVLLGLLNHPTTSIRIAAIEALGEIGDKAAIDPLLQRLVPFNSFTDSVLPATALALHKLRVPVDTLIALTKSADGPRRQGAANALRHYPGHAAVEALRNVLSTDSNPDVCGAAVESLALIGGAVAEPAIVAARERLLDKDCPGRSDDPLKWRDSSERFGKICQRALDHIAVSGLASDKEAARGGDATALRRVIARGSTLETARADVQTMIQLLGETAARTVFDMVMAGEFVHRAFIRQFDADLLSAALKDVAEGRGRDGALQIIRTVVQNEDRSMGPVQPVIEPLLRHANASVRRALPEVLFAMLICINHSRHQRDGYWAAETLRTMAASDKDEQIQASAAGLLETWAGR
jgi:hypothetical protein